LGGQSPKAKRFSALGWLCPPDPLTRSSAPGHSWGLCPDPCYRLVLRAFAMHVHPTFFDLTTPLSAVAVLWLQWRRRVWAAAWRHIVVDVRRSPATSCWSSRRSFTARSTCHSQSDHSSLTTYNSARYLGPVVKVKRGRGKGATGIT